MDEFGRELAGLLSLFAPAEIPWRLVEQCLPDWDEEDLEGVRNQQLLRGHLLQWTGKGYQLHQLLREFFAAKREQMANDVALKQMVCRVIVAKAVQMPTEPTLQHIEQFTPDIPHLKEVATTLCSWLTDADLIYPSTRVAQFYAGQADYESALPWYQHCLKTAEARLGSNHPHIATSLNNLAYFSQEQGRYQEAETLYRQALDIQEQKLGSDHPDIARSLNNLAVLYKIQGRYSEAEPLYVRSLTIDKKVYGADHPEVATDLNNLASFYQEQGRYAEAEPLYIRAITIWVNQLGANHPNTQTCKQNFLSLLQQATAARQAAQLSDHPLTQALLQQIQAGNGST